MDRAWGLPALTCGTLSPFAEMILGRVELLEDGQLYVVDSTDLSQRTGALSPLNAFAQIGSMIGPVFAYFVIYGFIHC